MLDRVCDGYVALHSSRVLHRYSRMLMYVYRKYGKLCIPHDLGYIFVNRKTGKMYKPVILEITPKRSGIIAAPKHAEAITKPIIDWDLSFPKQVGTE